MHPSPRQPARPRRAAALAAAVAAAAALAVTGTTPAAAGTAAATTTAGETAAAETVAGTAAADGDGPGTLLLVLDSSGSMAGAAAGGTTKIAAARSALDTVIRTAPSAGSVGMRVYGATSNSCTDSRLVVPPAPAAAAQKARLGAAVDAYAPKGNTPIAYSLQQAAHDLADVAGRRTIVLVSDGEETCHGDPCATARSIAAAGVDLKVDVVGLRVGAAARRQLQCIASAGRGTYYDAAGVADLTSSLTTSEVRAFRPFRLTGTKVTGATGSATPPTIGAGQYLDTLPASTTALHYRIRRTPGSTVRASATLYIPEQRGGFDSSTLELTTLDGRTCDSGANAEVSQVGLSQPAVTAVATGTDVYPDAGPDGCVEDPELLLTVQRGTAGDGSLAGDSPVPYELLVREDGAVADTDGLPLKVGKPAVVELPAAGHPAAGVGGTAFSDAPVVTAAGTTDTIRPGEGLVFRVPVDWGQQPAFRIDVGAADAAGREALGNAGRNLQFQLRNPMRQKVESTVSAFQDNSLDVGYLTYRGAPLTGFVTGAQVRYLNRTAGGTATIDEPGSYYLFVTLAAGLGDSDPDDFGVPVTIRGAALGDVTGVPEQASLSGAGPSSQPPSTQPGASPSAAATPSDSGTTGATGATGPATETTGAQGSGEQTSASSAPPAGDAAGRVDPAAAAQDTGLGTGARLGIGIGGLAVVALLVAGAVLLLRRPRPDRD